MSSYQLPSIVDPYSDHKFFEKNDPTAKKEIHPMELHKLVMYVIKDEFTEHHYEHVECPEKFTV